MKKLINKSLAILTLIAMAVTMSYADKNEAPILSGDRGFARIHPVDYITIHSIVMGKQNGSCKIDIKDIKFGYKATKKKLGEQISWIDEGDIDFSKSYGALCRPSSKENQNDKYIIVLTTNFGSYVYEYIYAEYEKEKAKKEGKGYILPLIDYKK